MPTLVLKSAVFDAVEDLNTAPDMTWAHEDTFDTLVNGDPAGGLRVLQLSSSLIRVSQAVWDYSTEIPQKVIYEMRLSGSGIGPVSSLDALTDAINNGLARGALTKLEIVQAGSPILKLTMGAAGYLLTSGDITVGLEGRLPLSFTQFADIAGLFEQVANIDQLTRAERNALFDDLGAYSVGGLTLTEAGKTVFAVRVDATTASLTLHDLTLTATGTFPDNLGEDVGVLWNLLEASGDGWVIPGFGGLDLTALTVTHASGKVLDSIQDPLADTREVIRVDGRVYDVVRNGDNGDDRMSAYGREKSMMAGLGGDDALTGGSLNDFLMGGSGNDTLMGKGGADRLDGGTGRDVLSGGAGADVFIFDLGDGLDRIIGFTARQDVIQILDATRKSDLTFTDMGDDVRIDYRSIHILVEGIELAALDQSINFLF